MKHRDFAARGDQTDDRCEARTKTGICPRHCKGIWEIPALGGYPRFSVSLCRQHGKRAKADYHARLLAGDPRRAGDL